MTLHNQRHHRPQHQAVIGHYGASLANYGLALLLTVATIILCDHLSLSFGERPILILLMVPILVSALVGGLGAGLTSTLITALYAAFHMNLPDSLGAISRYSLLQWGALIANGVLTSLLCEWLHRSRRRETERWQQLVASQKHVADSDARLRASEERFQFALAATADGLWDWDLRSGLAYLSPRYYEMSGYQPGEITPDFAFFKRTVHPDDLPGVLAILDAHLLGKSEAADVDYRLLTRSGTITWVSGKGRVVERAPGGAPLRMVGTISDITQRKAVEENLLHQTEELAQRNEELERFNDAMVGRELTMITLKQEVNRLSQQLGQPPPYPLTFLERPGDSSIQR